jgi:hypothetical protein
MVNTFIYWLDKHLSMKIIHASIVILEGQSTRTRETELVHVITLSNGHIIQRWWLQNMGHFYYSTQREKRN